MGMENGVILQSFHWYTNNGGIHWKWLRSQLPGFKNAGITALWLPPPCKCDNPANNVGYAPYDRWDLGTYDQKGQIETKYGSEADLRELCTAAVYQHIQIYFDAVFNHMAGADKTERVKAIVVAMDDRTHEIGDWIDIEAWTRFDFTGRLKDPDGKKRSAKTWTSHDFDAVDFAENLPAWGRTIFKIKGKKFQTAVSKEKGNYDYLCYADIDMDSNSAKDDLKRWGTWMLRNFNANGFRLDAVKHIRSFFFKEFTQHINSHFPDHFSVGEYWETSDTQLLHRFITDTAGMISLFDVPLQTKFHKASQASPRNAYDLRDLVRGTLSAEQPSLAVTFVENHDTMPCQKLEQSVEPWFKPWAYAFILLREQGYPTIFLADWTGTSYTDNNREVILYSHEWVLRRLLAVRYHCAWGFQQDYFDHPNSIGWTRFGNTHHAGLAVLINNGSEEGWKWMNTGRPRAPFIDILEHRGETIITDEKGWGCFTVNQESCSVWIPGDVQPWIRDMIP
jgi:alpha-amylase